MPNIFEQIIARELPAKIVYEDEQALAFKDIHPVAPVHLLVIPKKQIENIAALASEDLPLIGHLFGVIKQLAEQEKLTAQGYRVVSNVGEYGGQTVSHLHFHLLGGRPLSWPPG